MEIGSALTPWAKRVSHLIQISLTYSKEPDNSPHINCCLYRHTDFYMYNNMPYPKTLTRSLTYAQDLIMTQAIRSDFYNKVWWLIITDNNRVGAGFLTCTLSGKLSLIYNGDIPPDRTTGDPGQQPTINYDRGAQDFSIKQICDPLLP